MIIGLLNWAFVIFVIVAGYLVFLYFLHDILGDGGQPAKKEKKELSQVSKRGFCLSRKVAGLSPKNKKYNQNK